MKTGKYIYQNSHDESALNFYGLEGVIEKLERLLLELDNIESYRRTEGTLTKYEIREITKGRKYYKNIIASFSIC